MEKDEMKAFVARVRAGLKITKVVCTRSVKGKMGDSFVGFSAAWNSVQEDGGQGLVSVGDEGDDSETLNGMTMQEATVAACLVGREADIAAHNNALAGGNISVNYYNQAITAIKGNYAKMIVSALNGVNPNAADKPDTK